MLARVAVSAVCSVMMLAAQQAPAPDAQASVSIPASIFTRDALFSQATASPPPAPSDSQQKPTLANPPKRRSHRIDWTSGNALLFVLGLSAASIGGGIYLCATSNPSQNTPSGPVGHISGARLGGGIGAIGGGITLLWLEMAAY
jgi:hypothetical protein